MRGCEVALPGDHRFVIDRPVPGHPLRKATIENRDIVVSEDPEHPPHPGSRHHVAAVVDHDPDAVAKAQGAHPAGELLGPGQHVGQIRRVVGDLVDIEEHRAGNMALEVFRTWIAVLRRQIPGTVDDAHIRRIEQPCQGIGVNQGVSAHHCIPFTG